MPVKQTPTRGLAMLMWRRCCKLYPKAAERCKKHHERWINHIWRCLQGSTPESVEKRIIGRLHKITLQINDAEEYERGDRVRMACLRMANER